jgi:hypothetical protein
MLPEEELLSDKDLREASLEQLIHLRDRVVLEVQRREEREGMPAPPQRGPHVSEPSDPADPAEQPRPGESTERPASD